MSRTVIILGAKGRFGRAAVSAFSEAGWHVVALGRNMGDVQSPAGVKKIDCDVMNEADLTKACSGADVIVNAVNPPYSEWKALVPTLTSHVIAAAKANSAAILVPGNIYAYGADMPRILDESTPERPTTKKGEIRAEMEAQYRAAARDGVQTIVLRAGDFIEGLDTGNWFETYITRAISKGTMTYPGPTNVCHAWAYLPDVARAFVLLAEKKAELSGFETFGFEGFSMTGDELKTTIEQHLQKPLKFKKLPWIAIRILSIFQPQMREVLEMRYLWDVPHRIDGTKLHKFLPEFQATPKANAIAQAIQTNLR